MTRYGIDAAVALTLIRAGASVPAGDRLVGPAVLRSDVMRMLYAEHRAGDLDESAVRPLLDALAALPIRLLGDRVSRATAWRLAVEHDWPDLTHAEYLAVTVLQADVLVTEDPGLRAAADGLVPVAGLEALRPA